MKLKGEVRKDLIAAAIALALAAAYWIGAIRIHASSLIGKGVGADALPKGLAIALAVLTAILVGQTLWARRNRAVSADEAANPAELATARRKHLRAGGMLLIGVVFLAVVEIAGYVPATFLMVCATAVYNGRAMSWRLAAFAASLTLLFYALFDLILHIPMPSGIWPQVWHAIAG